jgi:hypothetical protein
MAMYGVLVTIVNGGQAIIVINTEAVAVEIK